MATVSGLLQGGGLGIMQGGGGGANFQSASSPSPLSNPGATLSLAKPLGATQSPIQQASAASSPTTTAASGINSPGYLQGLKDEYGSSISNAERQIPFYQNYEGTLQNNATTQAAQQTSDENNNFNSANSAYDTQKQAVGSQEKLSLAELADQIHGQNQGLINQLGTLGAGSSSAVGAGQGALAKVQNTNRADIQNQAGANTANISAAQNSLLTQHQANLDQIASFKTNTLNNIIGYYTPLIQNAQTAMHQAQGEEERLAAMYGLNAITQQATGALASLDNTVQALTQKSLSDLSAPENVSKLSVNAAPSPVSVPTVSPFNVGNSGASNTTAAPTGGSVSALLGQYKQQ